MSRPIGMSITQTVVTVPAATDTVLVAANPLRKYLSVVNIGVGLATVAFDKAAVANSGYPIAAAGTPGDQGGSLTWEAGVVTVNGIHAISTVGTTIVVLEGV